MALKIEYTGETHTPTRTKRATKMVEGMLDMADHAGTSASGWTAAMAIAYCEKRGLAYRLTVGAGHRGYFVEVLR